MPYLFYAIEVEKIVLKEIDQVFLRVIILSAIYGIAVWATNALTSLDLKPHVSLVTLIFGTVMRVSLTWILVLNLKMGLSGVYTSDII